MPYLNNSLRMHKSPKIINHLIVYQDNYNNLFGFCLYYTSIKNGEKQARSFGIETVVPVILY